MDAQLNIQRIHQEVIEPQLCKTRFDHEPDRTEVVLSKEDAEAVCEFLANFAYSQEES
jgi:hypothetical protein